MAKNQFGLKSQFLLGDFTKFDFKNYQVDLILASGVLYHMIDPIKLLVKISEVCERLFLWTHYFEQDFSLWNRNLHDLIENEKWEFKFPKIEFFKGLSITLVKQNYGNSKDCSGFCGGPMKSSYWIEKKDLISLLNLLGYKMIEIAFDEVDHQNGPAFFIYAEK